VPFSMSSLLRNLIAAKAKIQIQKTGAETSFYLITQLAPRKADWLHRLVRTYQ